jgi:hypothetical protein
MTAPFSDTPPEVEEVQIALLRDLPPWRKVAMVADLNTTVRALLLAGLRDRYPGASQDDLDRRLADLLLGPELAAAAFGALPEGGPK